MFEDLLQRLDEAGYTCIWGTANPKHFGEAVDRERVYIPGMLKEAAKSVGLDRMEIPKRPYKTGNIKNRCVADSLITPRIEAGQVSDTIFFTEYASKRKEFGEEWFIFRK